jgi:hypothetical protein
MAFLTAGNSVCKLCILFLVCIFLVASFPAFHPKKKTVLLWGYEYKCLDYADSAIRPGPHKLPNWWQVWIKIGQIELNNNEVDIITWKFNVNGVYIVSSSYKTQYLGATTWMMQHLPVESFDNFKMKIIASLTIQNRVWMADHLHRQGWPNCVFYPICKRAPETMIHIVIQCRFTTCIWYA